MRSDLNELAAIDQYLLRQLDEAEQQHFEAQLLISGSLAEKVAAQRLAHRLIRRYGRQRERERLERIHRQLLAEPGFFQQLKMIFS